MSDIIELLEERDKRNNELTYVFNHSFDNKLLYLHIESACRSEDQTIVPSIRIISDKNIINGIEFSQLQEMFDWLKLKGIVK